MSVLHRPDPSWGLNGILFGHENEEGGTTNLITGEVSLLTLVETHRVCLLKIPFDEIGTCVGTVDTSTTTTFL